MSDQAQGILRQREQAKQQKPATPEKADQPDISLAEQALCLILFPIMIVIAWGMCAAIEALKS